MRAQLTRLVSGRAASARFGLKARVTDATLPRSSALRLHSVVARSGWTTSFRCFSSFVRTLDLSPDVTLSGRLSEGEVSELAAKYTSWLSVVDDGPCAFKDRLEGAGCRVQQVPVPSKGATAEQAAAVLEALVSLPKPVMIQCRSGKRAEAVWLLWHAKQHGKNAVSARLLAEDMKFVIAEGGPILDWVLQQLEPSHESAQDGLVARMSMTDDAFVLEQFFDTQGSSTFTYMLGCKSTKEAILIDPVLGMEDRDLAQLESQGYKLKYVVNTHCHADHTTSGGVIRKRMPEVRTAIAEASGAKADIHLKDMDKVEFGDFHLECRATPGHTDGCMTLVLRGPGEPQVAFTGDTLLIRGCGRTDFQAGDSSMLYENVHQRVLSLPSKTRLYPGHDYKGRNVSTVQEEKLFNPRLTKSKDEFVDIMANLNLPYPRLIDTALPANMVCGVQD